MVAATTVRILEKIAPKAVATLGKAGVAEVAVLAGVVAEGLNLVFTPIVEKGSEFAKTKITAAAEAKKQAMLEKKAALLEQKAQKEAEAATEEVPVQTEEAVEEKPKTSNKKKGK